MPVSFGQASFELAFQISPIVFVKGIAEFIPGGVLPIGAVSQTQTFVGSVLSGNGLPGLDQTFPQFYPLPGSTLADFEIGKYPFANQAVAANATIAQPLTVSMRMLWPAQPSTGGFAARLMGMLAMQSAIKQHGTRGGTYIVLTPTYFYTNMILKRMSDISSGATRNPQSEWQLDFEQPLLTLEEAEQLQNSLMSKLTGGTQVDGQPAWSDAANQVGSANAAQAPNVIPGAVGIPAAQTSPATVGPVGIPR